jgi:hypothetical protein
MDNLNLEVKFMLAGDGRLHVKRAARIKVDGHGGLLLYDARGEAVQSISLGSLKSFHLERVNHIPTATVAPGFVC